MMVLLGTGAVAIASLDSLKGPPRLLEGGPPNPEEWTLAFEETFEADSLDPTRWEIGWGWGRETSISDARIVDENVSVSGGRLRITGSSDGSVALTGGINSKDMVTFGPGSYLEARIKFADREGFHNAFWAKPNSEAWPPEIDVVEQWHDEESREPNMTSHHHLHYSASGEVGDNSTHEDIGIAYEPGDDITTHFHVYGVEWRSDRIVHYVDRAKVKEWTNWAMLQSMKRGAPLYIMLNLHINSIGTADPSEPWTEEMVVDWVRLWQTSEEDDPHYFWVRSEDNRAAQFAFRTNQGEIHLDDDDTSVKYWVSRDRTTAGGTATRTNSLPGFWFKGDIVDFAYSGPVEVFIDNEVVDPDSLVDSSTPGPPLVSY